jgi:hypothetical protein
MKRLLLLAGITMLGLASVLAQTYPLKTLIDLQKVPLDSLKIADSLGIGANARWTLQSSPHTNALGTQKDTVTVVVLVKVPPRTITYTTLGKTLAVIDTGANGLLPWSGMLVRNGADSATADGDGFYNIERGDIIQMVGYVTEFPSSSMASLTQFVPLAGNPILILSSGNPIPPPPLMNLSDFNIGANPGGKTMFTTGEPWESKEVMFTNLTVGPAVNTFRGTFTVSDESNNVLSDYDWSYHFTSDLTAVDRINSPHDLNYKVPPAGTKIDTLRGYIGTASGGEAVRGYRICPIFPFDIVYGGKVAPAVNTHRRNPVVVTKDSAAVISCKIYVQQFGTPSPLKTQELYYSVNNGAWQVLPMSAPQAGVDSLYYATIPKQAAGTTVCYFIKATNADTAIVIYANAGSLTQNDSSKGLFFYKSLDRSAQKLLTIQDIQTTPFVNGRSPYVGGVDSTGGIVTADTATMRLSPISTSGGTNAWYIQSSNAKFSGLWLVDTGKVLLSKGLKNGDSIVVAGTINENFDVTRLERITSARIVSRNNALPTPVKLTTDVFGSGVANGNLGAEPYEGMLVQFDSLTLSSIQPTFVDPTEFEVSTNNTASPVLVRRDGRNTYTNDTSSAHVPGLKYLSQGNKIKSLIGIIYYNNSRYKITPRTDGDFIGVTLGIQVTRENALPDQYALDQNYPNPFNPATTIRYGIPNAAKVTLKIYNVLGQEVATLVDADQTAGTYNVRFDAGSLASGMYLYRINAGQFVQVKKMLLLK